MSGQLFSEDFLPRPRRVLGPGAVWMPNWLTLEQQRWIVARFGEWAAGPVPPRSATVGGHPMSVKTVCLGWHWRPNAYSRDAVDVNGRRVLDLPEWLARLGRVAVDDVADETGGIAGDDYRPDTALVNYYDDDARMGMHQDKDEYSDAPVVSLSIGNTCKFRFGHTESRNKPYRDIDLVSGDLVVFGGESRLAYHGVPKVYSGTAPDGCGLSAGRLNITMRVTGFGPPGS